MKTAICLSGLTRNYKSYLPRIKAFAESFDADIFIHTWSNRDQHNHDLLRQEDVDLISQELAPKLCDIEELDLFAPAFDQFNKWNFKKEHTTSHSANNYAYMYYSIYQSNFYKKYFEVYVKSSYDLVMRHRFDFIFEEPLTHKDFDMTKLNVLPINRDDGVADIFAAGSSTVMNVYSDLINHYDECCDHIKLLRPEDMLKYWLEKNKIELNVINKKYRIK